MDALHQRLRESEEGASVLQSRLAEAEAHAQVCSWEFMGIMHLDPVPDPSPFSTSSKPKPYPQMTLAFCLRRPGHAHSAAHSLQC